MQREVIFIGLIFLISFLLFSFEVLAAPLAYTHDTILPLEREFDPHAQFRTDLHTGAATYAYEIKIPPGTNELKPQLGLFYSNHLRNTRPGVVGTGWRLTENYIQRDTNFTRDDGSDDEFIRGKMIITNLEAYTGIEF